MFKWTSDTEEQVITLATTGHYTNREIADRIGCTKNTIIKFLRSRSIDISSTHGPQPIGEENELKILDLYSPSPSHHGMSIDEIAAELCLPMPGIRRVIEAALRNDYEDPKPSELIALDSVYNDEGYAPGDLSIPRVSEVPLRGCEIFYEPEEARYKVDQSHCDKRPITLAKSPTDFPLFKRYSDPAFYEQPAALAA